MTKGRGPRDARESDSKAPVPPEEPRQSNALPGSARVHSAPDPRVTVVGIGASAGGVEALSALFDAMPPDTGAAFVVIEHLDPKRQSHLVEVISHHTRMPVLGVEDGMAVEANRVFVIVPDHNLMLRDGLFHLTDSEPQRYLNRPVDTFFESLAADRQEKAIAMILSGTGTDGSAGLRAVKALGGIVIAQEPMSAQFSNMPASAIRTGLVDVVLKPANMPAVLERYLKHPYVVASEARAEGDELDEILALLRAGTGHDFASYKQRTLVRRIHRRMGLRHVERLPEYVRLLHSEPPEILALARDLMINVTGFFRDAPAWDALAELVVAPLVRGRSDGAEIRAWVPGCATGEEAYSLGMLLIEEAEKDGKQLSIKIFATDMAEEVLHNARTGVFPGSVVSELTEERRSRFFDRHDDSYQIRPQVRETIVFAPHDLSRDPPFSQLDIVTCRNLLIYLDTDWHAKVLALLHFGLREGGHLFLGTAETVGRRQDLFESVSKKWRIYRRVGPTRHDLVDFRVYAETQRPRELDPSSAGTIARRRNVNDWAERALAERYAPASVVVDRANRVLYFHGATDRFLAQPGGTPTQDLLLMARDGLRVGLRAALQAAAGAGGSAAVQTLVSRASEPRPVVVRVTRLRRVEAGEDFFLVSFEEKEGEEAKPAPVVADSERAAEDELETVQRELRGTIDELAAANEDLKVSNEEITSMLEELQSTNEELETSREELQSVNEELQSMNEEMNTVNGTLQAKLDELQRKSDDLANLLSSTDIATLFVDNELRIKWFTPAAQKLFDILPADIGRPIRHFAQRFTGPDLLAEATHVLETFVPGETEVRGENGRWYLRRVLPYRGKSGEVGGVVVTFVDITTQKSLGEALAQLASIVASSSDAIISETPEGLITTWNRGAEQLFGYSAKEAIGYSIDLIVPAEGLIEMEPLRERVARGEFIEAFETQRLRKNGETIWVSLSLSPVLDGEGKVVAVSAIKRDITAQKLAVDELELLTETLERRVSERTAWLRLLQDAAVIANESNSIVEALQVTLKRICLQSGWAAGHLYRVDEVRQLMPTDIWHLTEGRNWGPFVEAGQHLSFGPGEGPPGRAVASWQAHCASMEEYPKRVRREAERLGLRGALAFPIVTRDKVAAVLEFFADAPIEPAPDLLEAMAGIGTQLGRVIDRKELERQTARMALKEQQRIGEELHDTIGQLLTGIGMSAKVVQRKLAAQRAPESEQLTNMVSDIHDAQSQVRLMIRGLIPLEVDGLGLEGALTRLVDETRVTYGLECEFSSQGAMNIDDSVTATHLYQIAQEAVHNAVKHAHAKKISVTLHTDDPVRLEIWDDGVGIQIDADLSHGQGLRIMRHRASLIGATLHIAARVGGGTIVTCTFAEHVR